MSLQERRNICWILLGVCTVSPTQYGLDVLKPFELESLARLIETRCSIAMAQLHKNVFTFMASKPCSMCLKERKRSPIIVLKVIYVFRKLSHCD